MNGYPAPCVKCGRMVTMVKIKDTSLAVAMDSAPFETAYYTVDQWGYAVRGGALIEHGCDVGLVEQFASTLIGQTDFTELTKAAMARRCPKCDAEPGQPCMNLMERGRKGKEVPTKNPHPQRYPEPEPEQT